MASIIWCDRSKHVVEESRGEVERRIGQGKAQKHLNGPGEFNDFPGGFVYFTLDGGHQRALNVDFISSYEAVPGDGV
jgi:hypothetical protein